MRAGRIGLGGEFGDLALGFTEWGDPEARRAVLCVHGLTRNARDFDMIAGALARGGARVVCVDVAGRGLSDWLDDPRRYEPHTYARQIRCFMERMALDQVDWIGTSMGGIIGMLVASGEGSPVRRLLLNDIGPLVPAAAAAPIRTYLGLDLAFASLGDLEQHLRLIHAGFGPLHEAQWRHLALHSARREEGSWRLHYDPAIRVPFAETTGEDTDMWERWDRIAAPVMVLRGASSLLLPAEVAEEMTRRGPGARLVTFEGVGHAPALMAEDQISTVREFLES
ncbi:alpha/beta fold hydrolase [Marinimicrococcus flavescens]|uniref:Alpha/beta hydrolase n=1 Tax=Marinimicrococcus flavescens TaxID=3031815 RepID=A0AAP3V0T1_9PROT|nr:alpha/beta hydrolase [Marinimicrococcus flavescens]